MTIQSRKIFSIILIVILQITFYTKLKRKKLVYNPSDTLLDKTPEKNVQRYFYMYIIYIKFKYKYQQAQMKLY